MKNKGCLIGGGIFGFLVLIGIITIFWGISKFNNTIVPLDQKTQETWSNVESQYQRRADLIPNLVATVEKATDYEKATLTAVVEARAKATSIQVDPANLTPEKLAEFQGAQNQLSSSIGRLLLSFEKYPDLKANQSIMALQDQLEGTENRINIARDNFNSAVGEYNTAILKFPTSIIASFSGRHEKGYFKADAGAEKATKIEFSKDSDSKK